MRSLMEARWEPVFVHIGDSRLFDGTVISTHPDPHIVAVMEDEREAQLAALAPSLLRAMDGLLRHHGVFFPHGLTDGERVALERAKRVYSRAKTITPTASLPAHAVQPGEGHQ